MHRDMKGPRAMIKEKMMVMLMSTAILVKKVIWQSHITMPAPRVVIAPATTVPPMLLAAKTVR